MIDKFCLFVIEMNKADRFRKSGIKEIDQMEGREFELYLRHLFKSQGFHVEVTKASGDYGAALILTRSGKKIVVQAKRYIINVGLDAEQQVQAQCRIIMLRKHGSYRTGMIQKPHTCLPNRTRSGLSVEKN